MNGFFITNRQARQFLLKKHGLLDEHKFFGKDGAYEFIRSSGCIQFDPVDICGKNAEISLNSRVKGFKKEMLAQLLYKDRLLVDYPDKQLSIIPTENWHYFNRFREKARTHGAQFEELAKLEKTALEYIEKNGAVSSSELPIEGNIRWNSSIHWSGSWDGKTNAARAVLEQLYSTGELIIFNKKGTRKYYDLAKNHIPHHILNAPDPLPDDFEHLKWRVLRRIGAIGLLWNNNSDAFLGIHGLSNNVRAEIFNILVESKEIIPVNVEGIKSKFFCKKEDILLLEEILSENAKFKPRMELISPLDCLMWDRKLIKQLFDFAYRWEIYTPDSKRKFGACTLPIIFGETFIGRADISCDRKLNTLYVKNLWLEEGVKNTKKLQTALTRTFGRFAKFNDCII
ncbi:MAG: winged helix DNA-binding domain-containing protein [Defluviitaleaceae bacterium]|nr:winged helix DNA-binding domain-containing protein [Defluviitaleaceae bacterium]